MLKISSGALLWEPYFAAYNPLSCRRKQKETLHAVDAWSALVRKSGNSEKKTFRYASYVLRFTFYCACDQVLVLWSALQVVPSASVKVFACPLTVSV